MRRYSISNLEVLFRGGSTRHGGGTRPQMHFYLELNYVRVCIQWHFVRLEEGRIREMPCGQIASFKTGLVTKERHRAIFKLCAENAFSSSPRPSR